MNVMITGAGLVGTQVIAREQSAGRIPVVFDLDPDVAALGAVVDLNRCVLVRGGVDEYPEVAACVRDHAITRIIHTAAYPDLTRGGMASPLQTAKTNIMGAANVLEAARVGGVERVVLCSSSTVLTSVDRATSADTAYQEEPCSRPNTVYAASKQAAEDLGRAYAAGFGLEVVVVRFPAVFGPSASGGGGAASAVVDGWVRAAPGGAPVIVSPPTGDWVYSKDAAQGAQLACWTPGASGRIYHIGMGEAVTADSFVAALADVFPDGRFVRGDSAPPSPFVLDIGRARQELGYEVGYPVAAAIADHARDAIGWRVDTADRNGRRGVGP